MFNKILYAMYELLLHCLRNHTLQSDQLIYW